MSIFENSETPSSQDDPQTSKPASDNSFEHLLDEFKHENGERKYKDIDSALKALKHSQEYIPDIKGRLDATTAENEELKAQADKLSNLESIVEKLTAKEVPPATPASAGLDEQTVEQLLEQKLTQRDKDLTERGNLKEVTDALAAQYGTEAEKTFYDKATELGLDKDSFEKLAKTSPKAVLKFFPENKPAPRVSTGHNSAGIFTSTPEDGGTLKPPTESVLAGASTRDILAEMQRHKEAAYKKHNVQL